MHWDQSRHSRLRDEDYSRRTITASTAFTDLRVISFHQRLQFQPSQLVGFCASTSYGSAYMRTLPDPDAYLTELETRFRQASSNDMIPVDFELELILAREAR